jgi:hypothetical protein
MAKRGSHIDGRPELRHHHHDLHSPGSLAVMPTTDRRGDAGNPNVPLPLPHRSGDDAEK